MRKVAVLPMAGLLVLAIAAPASAGANVQNTSGSATVINAEWYSGGSSGYAYFTQTEYGPWAEFYDEAGTWLACDDFGESFGFVGTRMYGWGDDLTIVVDSRLDHGSVTGTLYAFTETVNECTGEYGGTKEGTIAVSAELDGVGEAVRFRDTGRFNIPGEFQSHSTQSGKQRTATGTIDFAEAGTRTLDGGVLASIRWRDHFRS